MDYVVTRESNHLKYPSSLDSGLENLIFRGSVPVQVRQKKFFFV